MVWFRILSTANIFVYFLIFSLYRPRLLEAQRYYYHAFPEVFIYPFLCLFYATIALGFSKSLVKMKEIPILNSLLLNAENIPFFVFSSLLVPVVWCWIFIPAFYFFVMLMTAHAVVCYIFYSMAACYLATGYCWLSKKKSGTHPEDSEFFYWHSLLLPVKGRSVNDKLRLILSINCLIPSWFFVIAEIVFWIEVKKLEWVFIWLLIASFRLYELKFFIGKDKNAFCYSMLLIAILSFMMAIVTANNRTAEFRDVLKFLIPAVISLPLAALDIWFFTKYKSNDEGNSNIAQMLFK
ncbi:unnamed protein product [Bursaphelenchus xylophilus]|uniref:(pine wood nematode) hypothetical protein n=1 Tax=Bursaphelenchus xylophilus TaxID=6326 RepID=A0A1I7S278_BURXY|nr:unnamed protein product [Bursaphelenchus xylophilus]CAG9114829.1 unnamed protein product [Bursaphelenchus xylophilus]